MTISPTLSTFTITPPTGGVFLPDGSVDATAVVTVRDTDDEPVPNAQVYVVGLAGGPAFEVDHDHVNGFTGALDIRFSYTDANGVASLPMRSYATGTVRYLARAGEDDGVIPSGPPLNAGQGKPERDFAVGPVAAITTSVTTATTIDSTWLASNTSDGVTVRGVLFTDTVTLAAAGVRFFDCVFDVPLTTQYALVTASHRHEATNCGFRGASDALVNGVGGVYDKCAFVAAGRDGVRLTQVGVTPPVGTDFESCLFRNIGIVTPGYALYGDPMQSVRVDHCWFDLCAETAPIRNTTSNYLGKALACIRQASTTGAGATPQVFNSWLSGGLAYVVEIVDGGNGSILSPAVRSCRFGALATYGPAACQYIDIDHTGAELRGNATDADGLLISSATLNERPGALFWWPQVALETQPEITWDVAGSGSGGGGGGSGGGGAGGSGTFGDPVIQESVMVRVQRIQSRGTGGGGPVTPTGPRIRTRKLTGGAAAAVAVPLPGGANPPTVLPPLVAEWDVTTANAAEGQTLVLRAELFNADGTPADQRRLTGYRMFPTVTNVSIGGVAAAQSSDYVLPVNMVWLPSRSVAEYHIQIVDDGGFETQESFRVTMTNVYTTNNEGTNVLTVQPGQNLSVDVFITESDTPTTPNVFFGIAALTRDEFDQAEINIPVRISHSPANQVVVRATQSGTASFAGSSQGGTLDCEVLNPVIPGTFDVAFQFDPGGSTEHTLRLSVLNDNVYEGNETVIYTLSVVGGTANVVTPSVFTLTITDNEQPPSAEPRIEFSAVALTVRENTEAVLLLRINNNENFQTPTTVRFRYEGVGSSPAALGLDYDIVTGGAVSISGDIVSVLFTPSDDAVALTIQGENRPDPQEQRRALLTLLDETGYTIEPTSSVVDLRIEDQIVTTGTQVFVQRIATGPANQMVRCTVKVPDTYDPQNGWSMSDGTTTRTAQWHPVAYKPTGAPDTVHLFAIMPGTTLSNPSTPTALTVAMGTGASYSPTYNLTTVRTDLIGAATLALELKAVGVTNAFRLQVTTSNDTQIIDGPGATTQGGGPRFYQRYVTKGPLREIGSADIPDSYCTAARIYTDYRADVECVVMSINWGNYKWRVPSGSTTHYTTNPDTDGEVYFEHLRLTNIPAGWAAYVLDPRPSRSAYDSVNSRVDIIKAPTDATKRNYVAPLRGHVAYIALYRTATCTATVAEQILKGYDIGATVGGIGVTHHDALGELGTPMLDYGSAGFHDQYSGQGGWIGARNFAERERNTLVSAVTGQTVLGSTGLAWGWWHGLEDPKGDNPGGSRISMGAGTAPGWPKWEMRKLELVHLWHRVGHSTWKHTGPAVTLDWATDEDFCVANGASYLSAVAMQNGKSGQKMAHQHFLVPDTQTVADVVKLGVGRKRATATITFSANPTAGDEITISDGIHGTPTVFRFGTGTDSTYLRHVAITAPSSAPIDPNTGQPHPNPNEWARDRTVEQFVASIKTIPSSGATARLCIHARTDGATVRLLAKYHGTVGNSATVSDGVDVGGVITVVTFAGGSNGTTVKPWNDLTTGGTVANPATMSCDHDINTAWHLKPMAGGNGWGGTDNTTFHTFDWGHMARMNAATRDGWWLMLDPIAHDHSVSLMHLGMQCFMRYDIDESSIFRNGTGSPPAREQLEALAGSNLAAIFHAMNAPLHGALLRWFETRFNTAASPYSNYGNGDGAGNVASNGGVNVGGWVTRNLNTRPNPVTFNPTTDSQSNFNDQRQHVIERGWGWMMCTVARGYAIEPAHRPSATYLDERTRILGNVTQYSLDTIRNGRPNWFTLLSRVIDGSAHRSGAIASQDAGSNPEPYFTVSDYGPVSFTSRSGAFPGGRGNALDGTQNAALENVHVAATRTWFQTYLVLGLYAISRRVYEWVDRENPPTAHAGSASDILAREVRVFDFFRRVFRAAERPDAPVGPLRVSAMSLVGVGDPATCYTASSTSTRGRFNAEFGSADPDAAFTGVNRANLSWFPGGNGGQHVNYYDVQYMLAAFIHWRLFRTVDAAKASQCYTDAQGLVGNRSNTGGTGASRSALLSYIGQQTSSGTPNDSTLDEGAPILQWLLTDPYIP